MHAIWTENTEAQHDVVHWMIQIAKPWIIWWWFEWKLTNTNLLVGILKQNANQITLK